MLIVVDVWIIYWWCEGNMFADYRHDVCQVQKKNLLLFWACKSRAVTSSFFTHTNHSSTCKVLNKTEFDKKMTQHCRVWISLLTDIKLNEKEGIQSTSVKTKDFEILILPMWVTKACCPLGNCIVLEATEVIFVKNDVE